MGRLFARINELIEEGDALVFVLIDEVGLRVQGSGVSSGLARGRSGVTCKGQGWGLKLVIRALGSG